MSSASVFLARCDPMRLFRKAISAGRLASTNSASAASSPDRSRATSFVSWGWSAVIRGLPSLEGRGQGRDYRAITQYPSLNPFPTRDRALMDNATFSSRRQPSHGEEPPWDLIAERIDAFAAAWDEAL